MTSNNASEPVLYDFKKLNELSIKFEKTFASRLNSVKNIYSDKTFNEFKGSDNKIFQFELLELSKLQKLIKARVTKFGLLLSEFYKMKDGKFQCNLEKVGKALYQEYLELQNNFYYSISVLKCIKTLEVTEGKNLDRVGYSSFMVANIEESLYTLFVVFEEMNILYIKYLDFNDGLEKNQEDKLKVLNNEKLLIIGKVWAINDHLISISTNWKKLFSEKLTTYGIQLIEDIIEEIDQFKANPQDFINIDNDPFGIETDYESEGGSDFEKTLTREQSENIEKSVEIFDTNFMNKLKLIKLLLTTSKKFIQGITESQLEKDGNNIYIILDKLNISFKDIVKQLDVVTLDIMENQVCDLSKLNPVIGTFKKQLKLISNNKNYEKFINTWNIKFSE
ncbi:hypothetical protein QEN19_000547 [Hanseniaspora menglaensis]